MLTNSTRSDGSTSIHPVTIEHRHQRGRPRKVTNEEYLREALDPSRNLPRTKFAKALGVHRNTLKRRIDDLGICCDYSTIGDAELDLLVKGYKVKKPDAGSRYVRGHIRSLGIRVQRQRVLNSLQRVDCIGRLIRRRAVIRRRKYLSSRPNALWHCDGHHKLIKYGFVIHGFIDGNCRTVCRVIMFAFRCLISDRSRLFVQAQTISLALSLNSSYLPRLCTGHHPGFVGTGVGRMSSLPRG